MFQLFIDQRSSGNIDFGEKILQFFLAREEQEQQKELLKIQKGQFELQQQQAQFQQQRVLDEAAGTALGLTAGAQEESLRQAAGLLGLIPQGTPGLGAFGQIGENLQDNASAIGDQQIRGLESPVARAAAATSQAEERVRADARRAQKTAERQTDIKIRDARAASERAHAIQVEANKIQRDRLEASKTDNQLKRLQIARDNASSRQENYQRLLGIFKEDPNGAAKASLLAYGTPRPMSPSALIAQEVRFISGEEEPPTSATLIGEYGQRMGVNENIIAELDEFFEQTRVNAPNSEDPLAEISGEEIWFMAQEAIDATSADRSVKEAEKVKVQIMLQALFEDPTLGIEVQPTGQGARGPRGPTQSIFGTVDVPQSAAAQADAALSQRGGGPVVAADLLDAELLNRIFQPPKR